VLVTSCSPLKIYIYRDGLVRFATDEYGKIDSENRKNTFQHLTNFSINKMNPSFVMTNDASSHKRSMLEFFNELQQNGINTKEIWDGIKKIVSRTLSSIQPILKHNSSSTVKGNILYDNFFEILGFDILLDKTSKPYLLEVNHSPSFSLGSSVDEKVKMGLLRDTFSILNITPKRKKNIIMHQRSRLSKNGVGKIPLVEMQNPILNEQPHPNKVELYQGTRLGLFEDIYSSDSQLLDESRRIISIVSEISGELNVIRRLPKSFNLVSTSQRPTKKKISTGLIKECRSPDFVRLKITKIQIPVKVNDVLIKDSNVKRRIIRSTQSKYPVIETDGFGRIISTSQSHKFARKSKTFYNDDAKTRTIKKHGMRINYFSTGDNWY